MPRRRANVPNEVTREDFENLRNKFQLLEGDRKAYFETYEQTKKQNDALIREIRAENQELRKAIGELKREQGSRGSATDDKQEIASETARTNKLRTEYDNLCNKTRDLKKK